MNIGTKIESLIKGFWNNTQAVSPVVASLVLVVVAITGAAGVGMIQGSLSSDVADEASTQGIVSSSGTELMIAGSTTVEPVAIALAEAYMVNNPGIRITVQSGGSGVGVASTGMDIVDLGMASRDIDDDEKLAYEHIQTHQIGSSAVVVILNGIEGTINKTELEKVYTLANEPGLVNLTVDASGNIAAAAPTTGTNYTVYDRAEKSGTEDTISEYLFADKKYIDGTNATGAIGNAGVLAAVASNDYSIGFVDFGFADGNTDVEIAGIEGYLNGTITSDNIKLELASEGNTKYVKALTRPLNFMTNGPASVTEQSFIDFAMLGSSIRYFEESGYFSMIDIAT